MVELLRLMNLNTINRKDAKDNKALAFFGHLNFISFAVNVFEIHKPQISTGMLIPHQAPYRCRNVSLGKCTG
jgi:hypothetical protein